jgi:hypothetical protein
VPDEARLREQAKDAIQNGKLPSSHDGSNPGFDKFHVHIRSFAVWEFERGKAGQL